MKKGLLLNSNISAVIAEMGHTDTLTIADAGLPVPPSAERIDLAVTHGIPDFLTVLETVLSELHVEKVTLAAEISEKNPDMLSRIEALLLKVSVEQGQTIPIEYVTHDEFKYMTFESSAVVRTGECTPYANILLHSGVVF